MANQITNSEFLQLFSRDATQTFILGGEAALIDLQLAKLATEQQAIIDEKREIASQSGDNWHDGAFNATDNAAKVLSDQASKLIKAREATIVDEPGAETEVVSIGTSVVIVQGNDQYELTIVGLSILFESDNDHQFCSLASPIAQALIGGKIGSSATVLLGEQEQVLTITGIDQTKVSELIMQQTATLK
jgi:transcription elongation GreA/GreB family factor